jgi:pSer/pThr/pTyr-binding forkhead associated (FHA) protein
MQWQLIVGEGKNKGQVIAIVRTPFVIGRDSTCQLRAAAASVSRQHCILIVREGRLFVVDCKTTNGTFVNSRRLEHRHELQSGDRLQVGPLTFVAQLAQRHATRKKLLREWDEEAAGEMLLNLDNPEKNHPTASATISEASALSGTKPQHEIVTPNENDRAPQVQRDTASAAEALLGKYARRAPVVHGSK